MNPKNKLNSPGQDNFENWSVIERIFAMSFYPIAMIVSLSVYFYLTANEYQPPIALLICEFPIVFFVIFFERLFPNRNEWNRAQGDVLTDVAHNILYYSVFLVSPILTTMIAGSLFWVFDPIFSSRQVAIWPNDWPLVVQLALALVISEFIAYWVHRAHHSIPILWRLHATHHSPNRLYWFNTGRFHLFNALFDILPVFVVLSMLGISVEVFMAFLLFTAINAFFQHGNLKIFIGPLNWIVSGAELHRWHHSDILKESNHNYGQNIILWDIVFGTRYFPKNIRQPKNIGITYPSYFPKSFAKQQFAPFIWEKILKNEE